MAPAYLLDLTRLASRLGAGALTGIDRVELAYLRQLLLRPGPVFGLLRTPAGVLLLSRPTMAVLRDWAEGAPLPQRSDLIGRLGRRGRPVLAAVEAGLRALAMARAPVFLSGAMLRRALPRGTVYLNVGHANLSDRFLGRLRQAGLGIVILLHDTIPLDFPQFARPDQALVAARRVAAVSAQADRVIHIAQATRATNEAQLARYGRVPPGIVAPLGITLTTPDASHLPPEVDLEGPYFVALGTIEPRKNLGLLVDLWSGQPSDAETLPPLYIVGNRGWADPALFERLDRGVPGVTVLTGLSDAAVAALLQSSAALLFPSFAEGFGLPVFEAAGLGVPVISSDLPVLREQLQDYPVYLSPTDSYSWMRTILSHVSQDARRSAAERRPDLPSWEDHFRTVLTGF